MVPYIPVRAKIFHMLPDLVENLRSLIASQYTEADRAICGRGNFILRLSHQVASWWRGTVVERRSRAGELSLSCARPAADG